MLAIRNFSGKFLKITLPEKLLPVLYTNGHISKSRKINELNFDTVSNLKAESVLPMIPNSFFSKCHLFLIVPCFVGVHHILTFTKQEVQYKFYLDSNDGILFKV